MSSNPPILDPGNVPVQADFWIMSMNDQAAWERLRGECLAEEKGAA